MTANQMARKFGWCVWSVLALTGCQGPVDEEAKKVFLSRTGSMSVTVFPSYIRSVKSSYDRESAQRIADALNQQKLAVATVGVAEVPMIGPVRMNQAKMFQHSARDLAEYVKGHAIETDYAVLMESLMGANGAIGIHVYVVDQKGVVVWGFLMNSHFKPFAKKNPKTVTDCTELMVEQLLEALSRKK